MTRGHAYFAERTSTIKKAMLRRIAAGAGRWGPHAGRHLEPNQRKEARYHAGGAEPRLLYPEMAEIALRNIERRAKHKVTRPEIKVGDMVDQG